MALTLIVDDDVDAAEMLAAQLAQRGHAVATANSLRDARRQMALQPPQLVLLDLRLPDGQGLSLFGAPELAGATVVLMTGYATLDTSIQAMRLGAADYLIKPVRPDQLDHVLERLRPDCVAPATDWQQELGRSGRFGHLVGRAPCMQRVYQQIARVAQTSVTVLVIGESGTGKELVARSLHERSRRSAQPFLAVNCGAISPQLMESEIFGHEKGSFTGADRQHQGFFEQAHGGTLFLDEVTEMPLELQVKLLRVLETGTFMRVGSTQQRQTDVRIVAATNRDPWRAVEDGRLREDLLYRLNVFPIVLPPLRERLEDLELLCRHFLADIGQREGQPKRLLPEALERLAEYRWPGNVRELRNVLQRVYVMTEGASIGTEWLPANPPARLRPPLPGAIAVDDEDAEGCISIPPGTPLADVEQRLILRTLRHFGNHRERTAAALGVSLKTLYNKLKTYESETR